MNASANPFPAAPPAQVQCILCTMWERMPHAKRYTTPTTAQDTEGALIIGFWTSSRAQQVPRFCPRHGSMLEVLDQQEELRIATENAIRAVAPSQEQQAQIAAIQARSAELMKRVAGGAAPVSPMLVPPVPVVAPQPPPGTQSFALGPGPLLNGQSTPPNLPPVPSPIGGHTPTNPPIPNAEPPKVAAPQGGGSYACGSCTFRGMRPDDLIEHIKRAHPSPGDPPLPPLAGPILAPPDPNVGTVQGALEAAKAPPTPGAVVEFPCPTCQQPVKTGETHACTG